MLVGILPKGDVLRVWFVRALPGIVACWLATRVAEVRGQAWCVNLFTHSPFRGELFYFPFKRVQRFFVVVCLSTQGCGMTRGFVELPLSPDAVRISGRCGCLSNNARDRSSPLVAELVAFPQSGAPWSLGAQGGNCIKVGTCQIG